MTTAIHRFPDPSRTHFVPWGLDTEEPSPLTNCKGSGKHSFNYKNWKLKHSKSIYLPKKKLSNLFGFLQSPEYLEGVVEVGHRDFESRSVATNTIHVPIRRRQPHCSRSMVWSHAAKQFLNEEDRSDKQGP